jgi:hypothetical protein
MIKIFLLTLSFLIFIPCAAFAQKEVALEFEGRYWFTELEGDVKVTENDIGTDIDLNEDLDIRDEGYPEIRLTWYTGKNSRIRAAYTQGEYDRDESLRRTIIFNGKIYPAGTQVLTDLDIRYLKIGWAWQFINIGEGVLKIGTLIEGMGFWVDGSLEAPTLSPPVKESEDFLLALPTIGLALDLRPHKMLNIFAEGSGIYAGNYGHVYDCEAGIKLIPIKLLSILGGYRILEFKGEHDDEHIKIRIHGPFVGLTVRF